MQKGKDSKPHIGIFGRRNNGKSSIINTLAGHDIAIVSDIAGTTTDPVKKSMEIPGIGPVVLIDTAGIDDVGDLGNLRIKKTLDTISIIDFALLVIINNTFGEYELNLIEKFNKFEIPFIIAHNKSDEQSLDKNKITLPDALKISDIIAISAKDKHNIALLIEKIKSGIPETAYLSKSLVGDLISYGDTVLLITPIDIEAPEGRMILPQVRTIRDVLDNDGIAIVLKEKEVDAWLRKSNITPKLAITDSQVFLKADAAIPKNIALTSFSILLARQKGDFYNYIKGTPQLSNLKNNDNVLILESCTHHVSCDDIGRAKIPRWLSNFSGKKLNYDVVAGLGTLPKPIQEYAIVIQCGGCVLTRKQIISRLKPAVDAGIPVTNYGMAIAFMHGIYQRAIAPFIQTEASSLDYL